MNPPAGSWLRGSGGPWITYTLASPIGWGGLFHTELTRAQLAREQALVVEHTRNGRGNALAAWCETRPAPRLAP